MEQKELNLAGQLKGLWRYKWTVTVMVLVAIVIAGVYAMTKPPLYEATATVMVESEQPSLSLTAGLGISNQQDVGNQIELMRSRTVLERAISQLDPEKVSDSQYLVSEINKLSHALTIQQVKGTSLLAVTVSSSDPLLAEKQANSVAEAYVYEANRAKLAAIEQGLERTTRQIKDLNESNLDISLSTSSTRLVEQTEAALSAVEAVAAQVKQMLARKPVISSRVNTLLPDQVAAALSEAQQLSVLTEKLHFGPAEIAAIEARARALSIKLETINTQLTEARRLEQDPQVYKILIDVEEWVHVAISAEEAVLAQITALSAAQAMSSAGTEKSNLVTGLEYRLVQHSRLVISSLETAHTKLSEATNLRTQQPVLLSALNEELASAQVTLETLSQKLVPSASDRSILLSLREISEIEIGVRATAKKLSALLARTDQVRADIFDPELNEEMLKMRSLLSAASDAVWDLPDVIASIGEGGGGRLGYAALDRLRQDLQLTLLTNDSSAIRVVDKAVVRYVDAGMFARYRSVVLAAIAALLLGVMIALLLQRLDRRVRDEPEMSDYLGLPLLGRISATISNPHSPSVLESKDPYYLETFRTLRTNLDMDSWHGRVLLVTSPAQGEGKTTVASNLARVVALQGRRVLLIDGSLRKPDLAESMGLVETAGLPEVFQSDDELLGLVSRVDGVDVIASKTLSAGSAEILSSPQMRALFEKARQTYDVVIVDSAPVDETADTRILARNADEALMVLQPDVSMIDRAKEATVALKNAGVRINGFIFNRR
ncbi:MAG: polysaccharide biosynthesis tyrosine autokinase [Dehalococcoidales bacterium]|nr:polysaccharide biosynthesis tyrosine autokinase [Dehalococcoidales bacterium]